MGCAQSRSTSPPARRSNAGPSLPKPPIDLDRVGHTAIWTGDEIIVWGGATTEFAGPNNLATIPLRDGALYRP